MAPKPTKPTAQTKTPTHREPLNELDLFAQMTRRIYQDPVWSGKVPNGAWRVLCWMIDRTTQNVQEDGVVFGVVQYNNRISYMDIAKDLSCTWKAIQRATAWLCGNGYLTRGKKAFSGGYRWNVVNSTRKLKAETVVLTPTSQKHPSSPPDIAAHEMEYLNRPTTTSFNIEDCEMCGKSQYLEAADPCMCVLNCGVCGRYAEACICDKVGEEEEEGDGGGNIPVLETGVLDYNYDPPQTDYDELN